LQVLVLWQLMVQAFAQGLLIELMALQGSTQSQFRSVKVLPIWVLHLRVVHKCVG